jgi:hypothetical protein
MSLKVPGPLTEPQDRPSTDGGQQARSTPRSPYSLQYETIVAQGHERPAPSFGAPTLIWHVAFWPRRQTNSGEDSDPNDTAGMPDSGHAKGQFETRRKLWHDEINLLLTRLQEKSSRHLGQVAPAVKTFKRVYPHEFKRTAGQARGSYVTPLEVLEHDTLAFTLWWADAIDADPIGHAIRVRVHAHVSSDYACLSFFMDIGQQWNEAHSSTLMCGARRSRLLQAARDVQELCEHQFVPVEGKAIAPVDLPAIPETMHSPDGRSQDALDRALREARNLLYVDAWEAFCEEFNFGLDKVAAARSEVFANFRGLVLCTNGMSATAPRAGVDAACVGTVAFPSFSADPRFNADGAEANAVAKAFWPFVRRITPRADYREFICYGVLNWRAIYISALGSSSQYVRGEERVASDVGTGEALIRVAPELIPEEERSQVDASARLDDQVRAREGPRGGNNHPVRYLLLTKQAPHPRQIGRIVERINAMGTMRLFALKDWAAVRNADPYIRILGQDLDQISESWSTDKNLISALKTSSDIKAARLDVDKMRRRVTRGLSGRWTVSEMKRLEAILPSYIPRSPANRAYRAVQWIRLHLLWRRKDYFALVKQMDEDLAGDVRHSVLYHISNDIEAAGDFRAA